MWLKIWSAWHIQWLPSCNDCCSPMTQFINEFRTENTHLLGCFKFDKHTFHFYNIHMMTSSNGNIFRVTGHLCGEFTGPRWIPHTKASDAELWCLLLICARINGWVNNREAGDLRCYRGHYDVTVMTNRDTAWIFEVLFHGKQGPALLINLHLLCTQELVYNQ